MPILNQAGDGFSESFRQTVVLRCLLGETCILAGQNSSPTIESFSASSGIEGDSLTITGTNFSRNSSENTVTLSGNVNASITSSSETSLTVLIPLNGKSGPITIQSKAGSVTSNASYTVYRYYVYVPGGTSMDIYKLDLANGNLSLVSGSPFASIPNGFFHPTGKFMYSSTGLAGANNVKRYTLDNTTGIVSSSNVTFGTGNNYPIYFDFHPSGKFLYVSNYTSLDISAFSIDATTGNLTKINDYLTGCGCGNLAQIKVTPNGKFLYVVHNGPNGISQFSIDQTSGTLTYVSDLIGGNTYDGLLVNPSSTSVFAVDLNNSVVSTSINTTSGSLTFFSTTPSSTGNYRGAMHPTGNYLYTVNTSSAPVSLAKLNIASDGSLSGLSTLVFGSNLQFVNIDPTGNYGFINNGSGTNTFYEFSINQSTGAPTLLNGGAAYNTPVGGSGIIFPVRFPQ